MMALLVLQSSELELSLPKWSVGVLQSTFSILMKVFPSPYVLFFGPERNYHHSFQIREPHRFSSCCTPQDVPRDATPKSFFLLIWQWEGPESKSRCHLQGFRGRKRWRLGLIVFQMVASNIMVELK